MRPPHNEESKPKRLTATFLTFCAVAYYGSAAEAEVIVIGPKPYLSAADSPFDLSGPGTTFFLEDFEDGQLNTPGLSVPPSPNHAVTKLPGPSTDSVDGDAGPVDGSGISGHSLESRSTITAFSYPPQFQSFISLRFEGDDLGFLPTAFGFAWTDGPPVSRLSVELKDEDFETIAEIRFDERFGDQDGGGQTAEDRFLGFITETGIHSVAITSLLSSDERRIEIDHVQYGAIVPEPSSVLLLGIGLMVMLGVRWRGRRTEVWLRFAPLLALRVCVAKRMTPTRSASEENARTKRGTGTSPGNHSEQLTDACSDPVPVLDLQQLLTTEGIES